MTILLKHNDTGYILKPSEDGWIYVTGADEFRFRQDKKQKWHFSKTVDYDLQVRLKKEVITQSVSNYGTSKFQDQHR